MGIHTFNLCWSRNIIHKPRRWISIQDLKYSKLERGMKIGIKPKFSKRLPFHPRSWFISCKNPQVMLKTSIHDLSLAIYLREIGWIHGQLNALKLHQLLPKIRSENRVPVIENWSRHTMLFEHILHVKGCYLRNSIWIDKATKWT